LQLSSKLFHPAGLVVAMLPIASAVSFQSTADCSSVLFASVVLVRIVTFVGEVVVLLVYELF
jgi:hypothetical protein